jgi:uncharacterized protein (TIGR02757 family)
MLSFFSDRLAVKDFLDEWVEKVNVQGFVEDDPILIPHRFNTKEDIEIAGFFAAILAWGKRKTIISKTSELMKLMDNAPYNFILQHQSSDLKRFEDYRHRTFQTTDLLYFIDFLKRHYTRYTSLEQAFYPDPSVAYDQERALIRFHQYFFDCSYSPERTKKHVATPLKKSTCKRLNMFLRWMVRKDDKGVDLGIWKTIPVYGLMMPLDVHVENTARKLKLISRPQRNWKTVTELTENLRTFDPDDPVKYDFALFGLGVLQIG